MKSEKVSAQKLSVLQKEHGREMSAGMEETLKNLNLKTNPKYVSAKKRLYLVGEVICLLLFSVSI